MAVENSLHALRTARGLTQEQAARFGGVSRQSYAAIEAGTAVPSTETALRLARAFGRGVEEIFRLRSAPARRVRARWVGERPTAGGRVRLFRVAGDLLAAAPGEGELASSAADGVILGEDGGLVEVALLEERPGEPALAAVGCDPAFGVVSGVLRRQRGVEVAWWQRGSVAALRALGRGEAHLAGAHLRDPDGGFNDHWVRELVPFPCTRVGFAWWEQGILVPAGNPADIRGVEDLARPGIRFLNREPGSGSRALLDEKLREAGVPSRVISGYETGARGHLSVAGAIASGLADAGIGIRAAGRAYGLDVVPLATERYELIIPDHFLDLPAVQALLETLRGAGVRAQVEALGGYDVAPMGVPC